MASSITFRVEGRTDAGELSARETVAEETPACLATSSIRILLTIFRMLNVAAPKIF